MRTNEKFLFLHFYILVPLLIGIGAFQKLVSKCIATIGYHLFIHHNG